MQATIKKQFGQAVLGETLCIAVLCFADMIWTIVAVHLGIAKESNPLMAALFQQSTVLFASVKLASFLVPLGSLELLRPIRPRLVERSLRLAFLLYLGLYVLGSLRAHGLI
jgi:hypothetical protein